MASAASIRALPRMVWRGLGWPCLRAYLLPAALRGQPRRLPWPLWRLVAPALWRRLRTPLWRAEEEARRQIRASADLGDLYTDDDLQGPFAATPLTLLVLWHWLRRRRPSAVLELGSGLSTLLFARYAERRAAAGDGAVHVVSVEHEIEWLDQTRRRLAAKGLEGSVTSALCPLAEQVLGPFQGVAYAAGPLADAAAGRRFDLCLIDGPPQQVGRGGGLPLVRPYLADGAAVFLDDAVRTGEQRAVADWRRWFPRRMMRSSAVITSRGLAAFRWKGESP